MGYRAATLVLALTACSRVAGIGDEFRAHDASGDGVIADAARDASPDAAMFSAPMRIAAFASTAFDGDPTLPSDMTEIYFKSDRTGGEGGQDIWRATRTTVNDPWSGLAPVAALSSSDHDTAPRISSDGLTMWLLKSPIAGGAGVIMTATRTSRTAPWSTPTAVSELNTSYVKLAVSSTNRLVGYVESSLGTGRPHVFRTVRATTSSPWQTPVEVVELLGAGFAQSPWATADDQAIIFSSDRPGTIGSGDLWLAVRPSPGAAFGTPMNILDVSSFDYDADPWISPDLRHIFYTCNTGGNYDVFEAHR